MKRLLIVLLVLSLINVCLGFALAEEVTATPEPERHTCGDYEYIILEDGTAEITMYESDDMGEYGVLTIPNQLDGYPVTVLGRGAFNYAAAEKIIIPEGVTRIRMGAFLLCHSVVDVDLPESLLYLDNSAFMACMVLTGIRIPDGLLSIGPNPFAQCYCLRNIVVSPDHPLFETVDGVLISKEDRRIICYPGGFTEEKYIISDGIEIIGTGAFHSNFYLKEVVIPESVNTIKGSAFRDSALVRLAIPESVKTIGKEAFLGCEDLTVYVVPGSYAEQYCIDNGVIYAYTDAQK